jgi:hypothetical protein
MCDIGTLKVRQPIYENDAASLLLMPDEVQALITIITQRDGIRHVKQHLRHKTIKTYCSAMRVIFMGIS